MAGLPAHLTPEARAFYGSIEVSLDGAVLEYVVEANTSEGWVICLKQNEYGEVYLDGDKFETEKLFGTVTARVVE